VPFCHKEKFHSKCKPVRFLVKEWQKGIVSKFFQNQPAIIFFSQHVAEGRLSGANIAFNTNVVIWKLDADRCWILLQK
jgi:hypothetical protein